MISATQETFEFGGITAAIEPASAAPHELLPLADYDQILVAFSGGKDSMACLLHLLDQGADPAKIELWHHEIDGREGSRMMDWPSTPSYCRAVAAAFKLPIYFSWKVGGFEREMLRDNTETAPTRFETPEGVGQAGGNSGKLGTRMKFPQSGVDLATRWCSAYLKIDVGMAALRNQPRFANSKTLFVTGERAQESSARAKYKTTEPHKADARDGKSRRHVDHWRPIHKWSEQGVWAAIERYRVNPHPAYRLGWGRLSCMLCIFGSPNQWASAVAIAPDAVQKIAGYEGRFGVTIDRKINVLEKAAKGTPYPASSNPAVVAEALDENWGGRVILEEGEWTTPAGAFGESAGPT